MSELFLASAILVAALIGVNFYRVGVGPTIFDRLLAVGLIGNNAVLLIVFMGFIYGRIDMFVDLAITYAILNFVGVVALGKYLESHRKGATVDAWDRGYHREAVRGGSAAPGVADRDDAVSEGDGEGRR